MRDTSQYGEATAIVEHFAGRIGRFLDVGAFDGTTFSNTWPLAEMGWSGVCVEPSPPAFCHLMKAYAGNEKITLVNAAIAPQSQWPETFLCNTADGVSADALSTFDRQHAIRFVAHPFREILIPRIGWLHFYACIAARQEPEFDFINIDVESMNSEVLAAMPFRPEMLCVELDGKDGDAVLRILQSWGYSVRRIGDNVLGVRQ